MQDSVLIETTGSVINTNTCEALLIFCFLGLEVYCESFKNATTLKGLKLSVNKCKVLMKSHQEVNMFSLSSWQI